MKKTYVWSLTQDKDTFLYSNTVFHSLWTMFVHKCKMNCLKSIFLGLIAANLILNFKLNIFQKKVNNSNYRSCNVVTATMLEMIWQWRGSITKLSLQSEPSLPPPSLHTQLMRASWCQYITYPWEPSPFSYTLSTFILGFELRLPLEIRNVT